MVKNLVIITLAALSFLIFVAFVIYYLLFLHGKSFIEITLLVNIGFYSLIVIQVIVILVLFFLLLMKYVYKRKYSKNKSEKQPEVIKPIIHRISKSEKPPVSYTSSYDMNIIENEVPANDTIADFVENMNLIN